MNQFSPPGDAGRLTRRRSAGITSHRTSRLRIPYRAGLLGLLLALPGLGWAQAPVVSGFSPSSALTGASVTITGSNLNAVKGVRFGTGTLTTNFVSQSATSLTVLVPEAAATGAIRLTNGAGQTATTPGTFTYLPRQNLRAALSPATSQNVCQPRTLTATASSPAFTYAGSIYPIANHSIEVAAVQPDGQVWAGGYWYQDDGDPGKGLNRSDTYGNQNAPFYI